jgi:hypothetical protein
VVEGEIGSNNCTGSSIGPLLNWSDANGVSYLAWAWNAESCSAEPSLITNYNGAPLRPMASATTITWWRRTGSRSAMVD